jgi:shikimate kinase
LTARLALIGAPGSGKSTVGRRISELWACPFIDTDAEYEALYGHSVAEAVIDDESAFRRRETELVTAALRRTAAVVAVGGGAVLADQVRAALAAVPTVWLEVGLVDAAKRTGLSGARPVALGNVRGQLDTMLKQRAGVYGEVCDLHVVTDGRTPEDIIADITTWEAQR